MRNEKIIKFLNELKEFETAIIEKLSFQNFDARAKHAENRYCLSIVVKLIENRYNNEDEITDSGWVSVEESLPEKLETVFISNGKGWTTIGCRSDWFINDKGESVWIWVATNGIIYEENGRIVSECEEEVFDVLFWHRLPKPKNINNNRFY